MIDLHFCCATDTSIYSIDENIKLIEQKKFYSVKSDDQIIKKISKSEEFLHHKTPNVIDIMTFVEQNPNWPTRTALIKKIEGHLDRDIDIKTIFDWLSQYKPTTESGIKQYALSILGCKNTYTEEEIKYLKKAWVTGKFTELELVNFGYRLDNIYKKKSRKSIKALDENLLKERIGHLIQNAFEKNSFDSTKILSIKTNLLNIISISNAKIKDQIMLMIKMIEAKKEDVKKIYSKTKYKNNDIIAFLHLQAIYKNLNSSEPITSDNIELIIKTPKRDSLKAKWWNIINCYAREKMIEGDLKTSFRLINSIKFTELDTSNTKLDWIFLKGFIEFKMNKLKNSLETFGLGVKSAVNKRYLSKFQYWQSHVASKLNNKDLASKLLNEAAKLYYTFYGQMAMKQLGLTLDKSKLHEEILTDGLIAKDENIKAIKYIMEYSSNAGLRERFAKGLINSLSNIRKKIAAYQFIAKYQDHSLNTDLARSIMSNHNVFLKEGYPIRKMHPNHTHTDHAIAHAIIRQESSFNTSVIASDGGLGLMQLMPETAKKISKKLNVSPDILKLTTDPDHNIRFGTYYLNSNIKLFDSKLLGIYSYNCGETKVMKYLDLFNDLHNLTDIEILKAMEKFPVNISREYAQWVWSNYMIYLTLLNGKTEFKKMKLNAKHAE